MPMSGNLGTAGNPGTPMSAAPFTFDLVDDDQNTVKSTPNAFCFGATPKPTTKSSLPGDDTSGTMGANVFGSDVGGGFSGSSLFWAPKPATTFDAAMTGTSTPAYSSFNEPDPSNPRTTLQYRIITAMLAYRGTSLEELRVQDYKRNCKTADTSGQMSSEARATSASPFWTPFTTQRPTIGSTFGGDATGTFEATWQQRTMTSPDMGSRIFGGTFSQPSLVLDSNKLECIEELLRKFFLGEELVNTQFHLFSAKSSESGRVMKPRVLCANHALLASSSKYFLDMLSTDTSPSDHSLVSITGDDGVPSSAPIDDFGYGSDSDLDDCDDAISVANSKVPKYRSASRDDDESSDDGTGSEVSDETAVRDTMDRFGSQTVTRLGSRHVLIKDTAFQTWYTLLNYLCTGKLSFLPLRSTTPGEQRGSSMSSLDVPRCSAKSMYRLAAKVGLDHLRDEACFYIRSNLTEHNILNELSCSILSNHPQLLEMELDVLYSHIASPLVVENFATLAQRVANKELPHGADIMVGIYTRLLKAHYPFARKPASLPTFSGPPQPVKTGERASDAPTEAGSSQLDQQRAQSEPLLLDPGDSESAPSVPPQVSASSTVTTALTIPTNGPNTQGKKRSARQRKR